MSSLARSRVVVALAAALLTAGLAAATSSGQVPSPTPGVSAAAPRLRVGGTVPSPLDLSAADIAALPHREVHAIDAHGRGGLFRGVDLVEILKRAGAAQGEGLRGSHLRDIVRVECADGYVVVFALAELDPGLGARAVLLADSRDGAPLPASEGPWRLVIPDEKRPARWARQVTTIRILAVD
jgi:DMSO/TMAO reductase YedYZ molybdopterin-dependent catalytic subunit